VVYDVAFITVCHVAERARDMKRDMEREGWGRREREGVC